MDTILWAIVGSFVSWELFAHFIGKNKRSHTLSNRIWAWEHNRPYKRAIVGTAMLYLTGHLVFQWPL
jgi:hypothetical protein